MPDENPFTTWKPSTPEVPRKEECETVEIYNIQEMNDLLDGGTELKNIKIRGNLHGHVVLNESHNDLILRFSSGTAITGMLKLIGCKRIRIIGKGGEQHLTAIDGFTEDAINEDISIHNTKIFNLFWHAIGRMSGKRILLSGLQLSSDECPFLNGNIANLTVQSSSFTSATSKEPAFRVYAVKGVLSDCSFWQQFEGSAGLKHSARIYGTVTKFFNSKFRGGRIAIGGHDAGPSSPYHRQEYAELNGCNINHQKTGLAIEACNTGLLLVKDTDITSFRTDFGIMAKQDVNVELVNSTFNCEPMTMDHVKRLPI